jgi:hypothetical protein
MLDKLENFVNRLNDMDWGWRPVLSLRPPKDRDMDNRLLIKLTLIFGSAVGVLFSTLILFVEVTTGGGNITPGSILSDFLCCLPVGWILFFPVFKLVFAYFWNRRARRLRRNQERQ